MRNLRHGMRGADVRDLQVTLKSAGARVTVDGIFGPQTEAAVRAYQELHGLAADGVVGPLTWCRLGAAGACPGPMLLGVDVSEFNARQPWQRHFADGVRFAMVRASSGVKRDAKVLQHMNDVASVGVEEQLAPGLYAYLRGDIDGAEQAGAFLAIADLVEQSAGPCVLAVDVEHRNPPAPRWDLEKYREALMDFLCWVRDDGRQCLIYGPRYTIAELQIDKATADLHPLWAVDLEPPLTTYGPWSDWTICQFKFGDANGAIDLDRFRGTPEAFAALARRR